jgi:hypothetical protein
VNYITFTILSIFDEVSIETIKNSFVKSGLKFTNTDLEIDQNESQSDHYIWNQLSQRIGLENLNFQQYVNFDNINNTSQKSPLN